MDSHLIPGSTLVILWTTRLMVDVSFFSLVSFSHPSRSEQTTTTTTKQALIVQEFQTEHSSKLQSQIVLYSVDVILGFVVVPFRHSSKVWLTGKAPLVVDLSL